MSVFAKVRNLGQYGIISDIDPYDLPPQAFSAGVNVRFRNGHVSRAPVYRSIGNLTTLEPRFLFASNPTSGVDLLFVGGLNGRVFLTTPGAQTDYSISGFSSTIAEAVWSGTHLADVVYINRADRAPWYYDGSIAGFKPLSNWPANTTAGLIRSCGGALVALNITQSGVNAPTMVLTSQFPTAGTVPPSWDFTNPATDATQNILAEMEGPIVDAQTLSSNLCIYGHNQSWIMVKTSAFEIFDYFKLPFNKGAINSNCSVEIDGLNYVFGPDDIWKHDGTSAASIISGRNRDFVFNSINQSQSSRCYVSYNPALKEIYFCYVSGDRLVNFLGVTGCNRAATYSIPDDTWTFDDHPSTFSGAYANLSQIQTWSSIAGTWATIGGTWQDQDDGFKRTACFCGDGQTAYNLTSNVYAFDLYGTGSTVAFPVDTNATVGAHLERDGIDLDALEGADLPDYKLFSSVYPLARIDPQSNTTLNIKFGTSDNYGQPAIFDGAVQTYDGNVNYKLDFNQTGRYASMYIDYDDYTTFSISGFDIAVDTTGER